MSWPLGELKALAIKAARGSGFSWSLAEEAGYATQWLEAQGVAGIKQLSDYLQWIEANGLLCAPTDMLGSSPEIDSLKCPIALGCFIADSHTRTFDVGLRVKQPAMLLPFLGLVAGDQLIVCKVNDVFVRVCAAGIDQAALEHPELNLAEATVSWRLADSTLPKCASNTRATYDMASLSVLLHLADKTYAPATEASRLAGAGAGTTDND